MNEVKVKIEVVEVPQNWKSAEESRAVATSLRNVKLTELMDNIMAKINLASGYGALSTIVKIGGGRHREVYERAQEVLCALGYAVKGETSAGSWDRDWVISW